MKRILKILVFGSFIFLIICFHVTSKKVYAQTPLEDQTFYDRLVSYQIPKTQLDELDTDELLDIVLDYPYLINMLLFNSYQQGLESVRTSYNGMEALFQREDIGSVLLMRYQQTEVLPNYSENNEAYLRILYLEVFLS